MKSWHVPAGMVSVLTAIAVGFVIQGPNVGLVFGAVLSCLLIYLMLRDNERKPIGPEVATDSRQRLLIVAMRAPQAGTDASALGNLIGTADDRTELAEIMIVSPARAGFLDRWTGDLAAARSTAEQIATAWGAMLERTGRVTIDLVVVDGDGIQATEDAFRSFAASQVVIATYPPSKDPQGHEEARALSRRLTVPAALLE